MEIMAVLRFLLAFLLGVDVSGRTADLAWEIIHVVLGALGVCTTAVGFAVPWFTTMRDIQNQQSVGDRSCLPYLSAAVNCVFLVVYGLFANGSSFIVGLYFIGAVLHLYYFCRFLCWCQYDGFMWGFVYAAIGFFCGGSIIALYATDVQRYSTFFRWICAGTRLLPAAAPLVNLPKVYRQRNMSSMPPLRFALLAFTNAIIWTAFGATGSEVDEFTIWSSLLASLFVMLQLVLHVILRPTGGLYQPLLLQ